MRIQLGNKRYAFLSFDIHKKIPQVLKPRDLEFI